MIRTNTEYIPQSDKMFFGKIAFLLLLQVMVLWGIVDAQQNVNLSSPNDQIRLQLSVDSVPNHRQLIYQVFMDGNRLVKGTIGFILDSSRIYGQSVSSMSIKKQEQYKYNFLTSRVRKEGCKTVKNTYIVKIQSTDNQSNFEININIYNTGIAYQYHVNPNGSPLTKSTSRIFLPDDAKLWWQSDISTYEANFNVGTYSNLTNHAQIGFPLTVRYSDGIYATFTEANLFGFTGSYLAYDSISRSLNYTLASSVTSNHNEKLHSAWDIMIIDRTLNGLVNNKIIQDVNLSPDPVLFPDGPLTDWIQPGKSLWTWMSNRRDVTPENIQRFTDLAEDLQIPYNLIDDGWVKWSQGDKNHWELLKEQIDYGKSKNVGIWVWQSYPPHNGTPGLIDRAYMRDFFKRCAQIGVKGVKIDFINGEDQTKVAFYERAARLAAEHHLMVDFHGSNKSTGMEYSYPNILTQEGVRGLEQQDNANWPVLNTTLPFTRYVAGPADYTPVSLASYVSSTTLAHQAATAVVFTSSFLCLGVDPDDLSKSPALPFIQRIPAVWDETIVLPGSRIGEVAIFARRKGTSWFIAVLNGNTPKTIDIQLGFLGNKEYSLVALKNDLNTRRTSILTDSNLNYKTHLQVSLPKGGGYLGIIQP